MWAKLDIIDVLFYSLISHVREKYVDLVGYNQLPVLQFNFPRGRKICGPDWI